MFPWPRRALGWAGRCRPQGVRLRVDLGRWARIEALRENNGMCSLRLGFFRCPGDESRNRGATGIFDGSKGDEGRLSGQIRPNSAA